MKAASNQWTTLPGVAAALGTCVIGAGWQVMTRLGVTTTLDPLDLAVFRYGIPALVLAPIWASGGLVPRGVPIHLLVLMVLGAGLPFGLLVMMGARHAPVAHMAVFLPGMMPIFVAVLASSMLGERLILMKAVGLALSLCGVAAIGWSSLRDLSLGTWRGDVLFLAAAAGWGLYTVAYRKSGLTPWAATAAISGWSAILLLPLWLGFNTGSLFRAPLPDLALQAVGQGLLAGIAGLWVYGYAVSAIGASPTAAIGALVPVLAALGGWLLLGEAVGLPAVIGVSLVTLGVLLSTGVFSRQWTKAVR